MLTPTRIDGVWTGDIGPGTNDKERRASMLNSEQIETLRRNADETPNHGYPTFPESGPNETLGMLGHALTDIDQRIDGISGEMGQLGVADIHDATDTGRALMTAADAEAAREAIGAGTSSFDGAYTSLTEVPTEFTPAPHTHVMADITDLQPAMDLKADKTAIPTVTTIEGAGEAGRAVIAANTVQDAVNALGLTSVYKYKGSVADTEALPEEAEPGDVYNVESDGMNYAWNGTAWDALGMNVTLAGLGVTATANELNMTAGATSNIQTQLDAKADASAITDMLTRTEAAETYQPKGEYQPKGDYATTDALADMETVTHATETYQPKGDYLTADAIADMETKANAAATYATKTEMTDGLALKQDAATAFDGKYTSLTEVPSEFTPKAHTHVMADITDTDLSQHANYEIAMDHVLTIKSTFASDAVSMKAGVYLVTEGDDTPAELESWKAGTGVTGTLTGYLHLFDYMPDGERHDHLALLMLAVRSADGSQYASGIFVFDGPQNKWMMQTSGMNQVRGLDAALALKADKTEIGDMLTKTEAASTYQVAGDYATKGELAAKADATAIADMLTTTEAAETYQPKGEYVAADAIADMETKTEAASTYATKGELAAKQDAATAFDGKYTSLTEVPAQFTPAAHTHAIADVTGLQDALDAKADAGTVEPADEGVTTAKLAPMAVTTEKMADAAVTTEKMADASVTAAKMAAGVIPTVPGKATAEADGLMSKEDKSKLDGVAANANNYTLTQATTEALGGVKTVGMPRDFYDGEAPGVTPNLVTQGIDDITDIETAKAYLKSLIGALNGLIGDFNTVSVQWGMFLQEAAKNGIMEIVD